MASRLEVVHHTSPLGAWTLLRARPPRPLRPFVTAYEGYVEHAGARGLRRRELPWPGVVIIINFGPRYRVAGIAPCSPSEGVFGSFVAGVHTRPVLVQSEDLAYAMQVNLTPIGARELFALPMSEIADRTVEFSDIAGPGAADLVERLAEACSWEDRFDFLDDWLTRSFARSSPVPAAVTAAWEAVSASRGGLPVGLIAHEAGWSRKHLAGQFAHHLGQTPKSLSRIVRFDHAVRALSSPLSRPLAEVAYSCGYYDQPHFNREFRTLAGMTPAAFRRDRLDDGTGLIEQR